eukprot:m.163283 g.163283  ORF g.163283 m.163283 type:complete len:135 (+) comp38850_c0_seq26:1522-1926(+)
MNRITLLLLLLQKREPNMMKFKKSHSRVKTIRTWTFLGLHTEAVFPDSTRGSCKNPDDKKFSCVEFAVNNLKTEASKLKLKNTKSSRPSSPDGGPLSIKGFQGELHGNLRMRKPMITPKPISRRSVSDCTDIKG